jgi:hypothetical protein
MRYECAEPFAGAFVEYSDAWSMGDRRRFTSERGEPWLDLVRAKVIAIYLPALEGDDITTPEALTVEGLERIDGRLYDWWRATPTQCLADLRSLGEALRPSSAIAGKE